MFLDIVDGYERFEYDKKTKEWIDSRNNPETKQTYRKDMVDWIREIRRCAEANKPQSIIIAQNATVLTLEKNYNELIDAISTEDLFLNNDQWKPSQGKIELLDRFKHLGKKVYSVEYTENRKLQLKTIKEANRLNFHPLITDRSLTDIGINKLE